jgi:hypothetical protein
MRASSICVLAAAFMLSAQAMAQANWSVHLRRAGPVRIGMTLAEVRRTLGDPEASLYVSNPDDPLGEEGCTYLETPNLPKGVGVMLINRRVARVDISEFGVRTASGGSVGDTEETIIAMYPGRIQVGPHKYDPQGHYLEFVPKDAADRDYGIIFETDGTRITSFRAGLRDAVAFVEGCL